MVSDRIQYPDFTRAFSSANSKFSRPFVSNALLTVLLKEIEWNVIC